MICTMDVTMFKDWYPQAQARSGLSDSKIAKAADISTAQISRYRAGKSSPSPEKVVGIGEVIADAMKLQGTERSAFINEGLIAAGYAPLFSEDITEHAPALMQDLREHMRSIQEAMRVLTGNTFKPATEEEHFFYDTISRFGTYVRLDHAPANVKDPETGLETPAGSVMTHIGPNTVLLFVITDALAPQYPAGSLLLLQMILKPSDRFSDNWYLYLENNKICIDKITGYDFKQTYTLASSKAVSLQDVSFFAVVLGDGSLKLPE